MILIECENTREIPSKPLELYSIGKGETVEDAISRFKARFGAEPEKVWHWRNFVYCEKP